MDGFSSFIILQIEFLGVANVEEGEFSEEMLHIIDNIEHPFVYIRTIESHKGTLKYLLTLHII